MMTCRQSSELVSQSYERRLSLGERLALRLHLLICDGCTNFKRQVEFLHRAAGEYLRRGVEAAQQVRLSSEARRRIRDAVNAAGDRP